MDLDPRLHRAGAPDGPRAGAGADGRLVVGAATLAPAQGGPRSSRTAAGLGGRVLARARLQRCSKTHGHHRRPARGGAAAVRHREPRGLPLHLTDPNIVPAWVVVACGAAMGLGTVTGGWR